MLKDKLGRSFEVLRVSLTNTCNFACTYCVHEDSPVERPHQAEILSPAELLRLISELQAHLSLKTVRLTGGEPLLYRQLPELVDGIRCLGIADIRLTTNGFLLKNMAAKLRENGLQSVNVSLDAIRPEVFSAMARRSGVDKVLDGIKAAKDVGLDVKINTVIMKGINEEEIIPLLHFASGQDVCIRFLELMAMGHLHGRKDDCFYGQQQILDVISSRFGATRMDRKKSSTATYWETDCGKMFGIIANESAPFCGDCNRLRLDAMGNIYGCLSSNLPIAIRQDKRIGDMGQALEQALAQKQQQFIGSELSMLQIGG